MPVQVRRVLWLLALTWLLVPAVMRAQEAVTASGCLKQGAEKGGYYLVAQDGKMYELMGKPGELSKHVNHTITISGQEAKLPEAQEKKLEPSEKTEAGTNSYMDVRVADVKMVSADCSH